MEVVRVEEVVAERDGLPAAIQVVEINEFHQRRVVGLIPVVDTPEGRTIARFNIDNLLNVPEPVLATKYLSEAELAVFKDNKDS